MQQPPHRALIGDPLPEAVAAVLRAVGSRRAGAVGVAAGTADGHPVGSDDLVAVLAPDVSVALPPPGVQETAPRAVALGPEDTVDALRRHHAGPGLRPEVCAVVDGCCLIDGVGLSPRSGGGARSADGARPPTDAVGFSAWFRLDTDGLVRRLLLFTRTPALLRLPPPGAGGRADRGGRGGPENPVVAAADRRRRLERYFEALDHGRFEQAAACFSPDIGYSPPRPAGSGSAGEAWGYSGRDELLAGFLRRGPQSFSHQLLVTAVRQDECLGVGVVRNDDGSTLGDFMAVASFDAERKIRRYVAHFCPSAIEPERRERPGR